MKMFFVILALLCAGCYNESDQIRFFSAASDGKVEAVRELLEKGNVDVNSQNAGAGPALSFASYSGDREIVSLLLEYRADINIKDPNGFTPLMNAALGQQVEIVRLLLEKGADPTLTVENAEPGKNPVTAVAIAKAKQNKEIIDLIERYSQKQNPPAK
jgi:ankyrin repeat protein